MARAEADECGSCRLPLAADRAGRQRRLVERRERDVVGVRERLLLAAHGANADATVDAERPGLDDALLEAPALDARILEIEVGEIHVMRVDRREDAREVRVVEPRRVKQEVAGFGDQRAIDSGKGKIGHGSPLASGDG